MDDNKNTNLNTNTDNQDNQPGDTGKPEQKTEKTIDEILAEERAKWEKEKDKAVTDAIKKREAKMKAEAEEKERLAKMTEEERIKELEKQKQDELAKRERALEEKEIKLTLVDILTAENMDISYKDFIDTNKYVGMENKEEVLKQDVLKLKEIHNKAVEKQVEAFRSEFLKGETPSGIKQNNITDYDKASKTGNPFNMILSKLK